ncbi:MAG: T9SS type A sorting domain-containing protein [Chitinophagaceae bacterium]|nr:T9SS type A sorting domain-containing protein [Chitinophagaceae bacterium]
MDTSLDNGASWAPINNNVAATARSLSWVVPATLTNNALIRVRRNSSAYSDQSDYPFTILGMPVVTATVPCEGFVQLDWPAITGATSYDVFQLKGDSMSLIGNTAGLSYLVSGLNASTTYWFGVSAKNGTVNGRRSVSKSALPSTGVCTLAGFDNNFKAVSIDAPVTGRQFTSSSLGATESIKLTFRNLDNVASSGIYNLSYQVNSDPVVTESGSAVIAALGSLQYTFTQTANFSAPGIYTIRAWVKHVGDNQAADDTVTVVIKQLANPVLTLPTPEGFESAIQKDYVVNTIGLDSIDRVDFKTNSMRGRARTFVNTGFALNGNRAITLDQFPYGALSTDSLLLTYNASNYNSGNQLRFDLYYKNHGQDNNPNNKVWIRGGDDKPWVFAYDLVANQAGLGGWKHALINVNDVLDTVVPAQPITSSFQVKIGQQGITSANMANPILDQDDGYTIDDVLLSEALNDVAISQVISPSLSGCAMNGVQPVTIRIKNYSATSFTNVPVSYSINGAAPVTELVPAIGANSTQDYTFTATANLLQNTDYRFDLWVKAPADNYAANDSVLNYNFHTSPVISSFPYLEGFEGNDGSWYTKGSNSSWQWGTPAKTVINKAANGTKAWVTNLAGNYANNELSYLYSPCFNLSGLTQPVLSFSHIFSIEDGCPCDYTWVDYSTDGGVTWNRLGTNGGGINWYNDPTALHQWRTSFGKWHVASVNVPTTGSSVRFRFVMASDAGFNTEGVGIDDIHVFDKAAIYTGGQLLNSTQNVSGANWVHYISGGTRFASINANGQNLGNTVVDVYPYAGAVRNHNGQYYLNRNLVIRPANQPVGYVSVRFYFTDAEAKSLIAATGCTPCTKPGDPYELGVTKYSGPVLQENGILTDNLPGGSYQYILPANTEIIPYDNGYYAEFPVNSFSEFWLNNGGLGGNTPLPVSLVSFEAVKQNKQALLQWVTDNELNTASFVVERSGDGSRYNPIGTVAALNGSGNNNYRLTDALPLPALNFYRLKIIDRDGTFGYSPVRKVDFSTADDDITIYPNPVSEGILNISSTGNCNSALIYDTEGKLVRQFSLQGRNNRLSLEGLAPGIYQLKLFSTHSIQVKKLLVR